MLKKIWYSFWKIIFIVKNKFQENFIKIRETITLQDLEPPSSSVNEPTTNYYTLLKDGVVYENNNGKEVYIYPCDMSQEELIEIIKEHRQDELLYSRF